MIVKLGKGGNMFDEHRRPLGRLFYLLAFVVVGLGVSRGQGPATSTIQDIVYRADGTLAGGTLLISWPTFSTAAGQSVAAGRKSVNLAPGGVLSVELVPNTGSAPAGTFNTVVYQLDDGTVKTEFWTVTASSPTTIAAVRTTLGSGTSGVTSSGGGPFVSKAGDSMTGPLQLPGEKSEIRRGVYDRIVNAAITVAISAAIAMHDRWSFK
jgi:trimeric autotransporter adhesin